MRSTLHPHRSQAANTLVIVIVLGGIMSTIVASMLSLSSASLSNAHGRTDWNMAFFHAENAMQWAAQNVADVNPATSNYYSTANGLLALPYMAASKSDPGNGFRNAWVSVVRTNASFPDNYLVTASARVGDKVRTVQATVIKNPASQIFDYEYFLNNWGWWWGQSITGNGGNRANWDFDFRDHPTVNGLILANGSITQNGSPVNQLTNNAPFGGQAGSDPLAFAHMGVPRVPMPNLKDLSYYSTKALADTDANGLWVGGTNVVRAVHADVNKPGLYLVGTDANPIVISNTVVVQGDVVIKGKITGQGTLYVGGNLYVAGDITYKNGPNWNSPPETMEPAQRDEWVLNNKNKDLVAFAVRGSVLGGDVTSSDWKGWCYDPTAWGLSTVGDETHLGADGIQGTPDDNTPFLHADGSTTTAFDADGNGMIEGNFNYATQLTMNGARAAKISGYPLDNLGAPLAFNTLASNDLGALDAIFYTNHAVAMRLARGNASFHGIVVSRNEALVYNSTCVFNYDSRVHSRYNKDPNRFIDLGLPIAGIIRLDNFVELLPNSANL